MVTHLGFKETFFQKLDELTQDQREIFDRIYQVWETHGQLVPPQEMISWIQSTFGDIDAVTNQSFLKITNKITYEGSIFNELRTKRPIVGDANIAQVFEEINLATNTPFANPLIGTPADVFGRIEGKYCITASNVAKCDGLHGVIIFNSNNPLLLSRRRVLDYFDVARKWFTKAHETNGNAIYPLFIWNCLWKAGASIIHGHAQTVLTEGQTYAKIEELRHHALKYQEQYRSNYFDDDFAIHKLLGLAIEFGEIRLMVRITPFKEKEIMILSPKFDDHLSIVVADTLNTLKEKMGVVSFNASFILPPMAKTPEVWEHMPVVGRIVDRGKLTTKTGDIGAMEIYAQSVIETNPYIIIGKLKEALENPYNLERLANVN